MVLRARLEGRDRAPLTRTRAGGQPGVDAACQQSCWGLGKERVSENRRFVTIGLTTAQHEGALGRIDHALRPTAQSLRVGFCDLDYVIGDV